MMAETIDRARVAREARQFGVELSEEQTLSLDRFAARLLEVNQIHNLTSVTDPRDIEIRHFLDCLAICAMPELGRLVLDVGTGAGFPGVVIAVARPDCLVTLLEAREKKINFVRDLSDMLGIAPRIIRGRAEEIRDAELTGSFDTVVARAVAPLPRLVPLAVPMLKTGGTLIAMKGPKASEELRETEPLLAGYGVKRLENRDYSLPGGLMRTAVILQKIGCQK